MPNTKPQSKRRRKRRKPVAKTRISKMVTLRIKQAEALVSAIRVHREDVGSALSLRFAPAMRTGESLPDHGLTLELAARSVELAIDRLTELDDSHALITNQRDAARRDLEQISKQELYPRAVSVRRAIDAAIGRQAGSKLHTMIGATPRATDTLREHVRRALNHLSNPAVRTPKPMPGETLELDRWHKRLNAPYRKLAEKNRDLTHHQQQLELLRQERNEAMRHFDANYTETLQFVTALLRIGGQSERVIRNLRPYYQRRRLSSQARKKRKGRAADASRSNVPSIADTKQPKASDASTSVDAKIPKTSDASASVDAKIPKTSDASASVDAKIPKTSDASSSVDAKMLSASLIDASTAIG